MERPAALATVTPHDWKIFEVLFGVMPSRVVQLFVVAFLLFLAITLLLDGNGYSLHRLYRDRLSKAFLFNPTATLGTEPAPLDHLKLSGT